MEPAQRAQVLGLRGSGLWSAFCLGVVVVLDDVVDVAAPRRPTAEWEHAGAVAEDHVLADPVRDLVARRGLLLVEVDDGLDRDLRARVAAPGPELLRAGEVAGLPRAARSARRPWCRRTWLASKWAWRTTSRAAGRSGLDTPARSSPATRPPAESWRSSAVCVRAGHPGLGPPCVETTPPSRGPSEVAAPWARAWWRSRPSARSTSASRRTVPAKCTSSSWIVTWRGSTWRYPSSGSVGRIHAGEVEPLDRLRDEPVQLRGTDLPRDRGDLGVDEPGRLDRQRRCRVDGDLRDGPSAPSGDASGVDLRPESREAVAQLEGVADELLRRHRRDAEDGAELGDAELRDQRRTRTGDGLLVLTARDR